MSGNTNVRTTVKFYNAQKGFGILKGPKRDMFIHVSVAGEMAEELIPGAIAIVDYVTAYQGGEYKDSATRLDRVEESFETEVLDTVKFYANAKNFGFMNCAGAGFSRDEAFLHGSIVAKAGVIPGKDMPVRALVREGLKGPEVISFEWGEEVEAAYTAKLANLHAEDGAEVSEVEVSAEKPKPKSRQRRKPGTRKAAKPAAKSADTKKSAPKKAPAKKAKSSGGCDVAAAVAASTGSGAIAGALADACNGTTRH